MSEADATDAAAMAVLPLTRPIRVDGLPSSGREVKVEASPVECAAVALDFGLPGIAGLVGRFRLLPQRGRVLVTGEVEARLTQSCVVTLEPFDAQVREPVDLVFAEIKPVPSATPARPRQRPTQSEPLEVDVSGEDPPEPIVEGQIDLGALTLEFLALGLDPHPRKPDVDFGSDAKSLAGGQVSPFAALGALRKPDDPA